MTRLQRTIILLLLIMAVAGALGILGWIIFSDLRTVPTTGGRASTPTEHETAAPTAMPPQSEEAPSAEASFAPTRPLETPLPATWHAPNWAGHGDFDGDGLLDLAVLDSQPPALSIVRGEGRAWDGQMERYSPDFTLPLAGMPTDAHIGDFDQDGLDDVAVALRSGPANQGVLILWGGRDAAHLTAGRLSLPFAPGLLLPAPGADTPLYASTERGFLPIQIGAGRALAPGQLVEASPWWDGAFLPAACLLSTDEGDPALLFIDASGESLQLSLHDGEHVIPLAPVVAPTFLACADLDAGAPGEEIILAAGRDMSIGRLVPRPSPAVTWTQSWQLSSVPKALIPLPSPTEGSAADLLLLSADGEELVRCVLDASGEPSHYVLSAPALATALGDTDGDAHADLTIIQGLPGGELFFMTLRAIVSPTSS